MEYPIPLLKTVVMAATLVVMYVVMFRPSKTHTATMWSDGLYCHHLDAWYYGAWMSGRFFVEPVVIRSRSVFGWRTVIVFKTTESGLSMLGFARRIPKQYYHYTQVANA
jgi:hypothetical protein